MIRDFDKTVAYLVDWMKEHAARAGAKGATVGVSGGIDSALTLALAVKAFGRENVLGVLMPCQSSESSTNRGKELVRCYEVPYQIIDLGTSFESITRQGRSPAQGQENFCYGALRSCLRAPVLDYYAKVHGHLVFGTGNRDEDEFFRYYQKRGDGAVDNNAILALHKSEVFALSKHLGVPQSILDAKPTADLWGADAGQEDEKELGISYDEIEWVTRENDRFGVIFTIQTREDTEKRVCNPYTDRQWYVIERARQAEKSTRHKACPPPGTRRAEMREAGLLV